MSVMIRGMKMPNSCLECDFLESSIVYNGNYICECPSVKSCGKNVTEATEKGIRDLHCPLVEVQKPHGRLIDADGIIKKMDEMNVGGVVFGTAVDYVKLTVNDAPTIIEAEGEGWEQY